MLKLEDITITIVPNGKGFWWFCQVPDDDDYCFVAEGSERTYEFACAAAFVSYQQAKRYIEIGN
jgi:hypothetical protein